MEQDVAGVEQRWAAIDHRGPYLLLMVGALLAVPTGGLFDMGPGDWYTVGGLVAAGLVLQVWWGTVADSRRGPSCFGGGGRTGDGGDGTTTEQTTEGPTGHFGLRSSPRP
ncbi:hypothetical protein [Streptomyces sp. NBC_00996]|uniref:hypothetical protein n=1 Tax=Streptomyces sp. NBC_00996 TaxID=2903710 RepID=UPI00386DC614|nr:hypothetical protein OG390_35650 [Streptomyces sp. NBC_00996]